jgi:hypothetical protein
MIASFRACHGIIANAPATLAVHASAPIVMQRTFQGTGAPTSSVLSAGNGRYCASTGGWVIDATIVTGSAGSGYLVGDVLTVGGGTNTTATQFMVDMVDAAGGVLDFHCVTVGVYTAYPTAGVGATGGTGTGATFNLAKQPADMYLDYTAKALYICTTPGSYTTSGWAQITGPSNPTIEIYNNAHAYPVGSIVFVFSAMTVGGIAILPGVYASIVSVPANGSVNQIPQYPLPASGTVYWYAISMGIIVADVCTSSGSQQIYMNASGTF